MQQPPIDGPSFRRILTSAAVAPLIIMALLAGALLWQIDSYRRATRAVIRSDRTIALASQLQRLLVDSETGLRSYLLTGVNDFLNPYNQVYPQLDMLGENLSTRVADQSEQVRRIKQVIQDYGQWREYADRTLQLRKDGGDYVSLVASGAGKQIMDGIRAQMSDFIQSEESLRDMRAEDAQQTAQVVIYTSLALVLIVGALLAFFSRRQLVTLSRSYNQAFALAAERAAQIAEERQRLNAIVTYVPGVVWEAWGQPDAASQRINFVSDYVETMLGYSVQEWLATPNFWLTVVHPDDRERAAVEAAAIFASGKQGISEFRWVTRDGRVLWVEAHSAVIADAAGVPVGMRGVTMDVTTRKLAESERRRADAALRASEQRYRDLADAMPLIVWTAKPNGNVDYYNQRWIDYTGLTREQSYGSGWQMVLHPGDLQNAIERWSEAVNNGQPYEIEYRWRRADGIYRWHLGRALPVRDDAGQIAYWVGTGTDIEEQKRVEDQQRLLAEASVLLVGSLDYESTMALLARLAVPRMADWCAVHILEEHGDIRRLAFMHSDPAKRALVGDRPERYALDPSARHIVSHVLRSGEPELYSEVSDSMLIGAARDHEHLQTLRALGFTSYMCLPMVARGHVLGTITFVTAESGRRYGKAELAFGEDLTSRAAIALDNARLYRDAQAAVRARDQFLSIASHELKTPLTSLMGYVELMQRRAARSGDLAERDRRAIRVIGEQAGRLNKLVGALLDLSRIETGQLSIERGLVDLNALARRLVEETRPITDRHTISFSGSDQPIMLLADELRLEQVVQNLLQNAIKYSPIGGAVTVQVDRDDEHARVRVSDQGIGIPQSARPLLFRRFYRASNADSQHISGMGIGLYVVKEIVELHGGTVEVDSQEGQGSTFTIRVPLIAVEE